MKQDILRCRYYLLYVTLYMNCGLRFGTKAKAQQYLRNSNNLVSHYPAKELWPEMSPQVRILSWLKGQRCCTANISY